MRLVDTHCHLDARRYAGDLAEVLDRAVRAGVWRIVCPGIDRQSSRDVLRLAAEHTCIYAAVGIHPNACAGFTKADIDAIGAMARGGSAAKVVAIGEIGLDYYRDYTPHKEQHRAFEAQLALAVELKLPVIIHNRASDDDMLRVLARWVDLLPDPPGVLHSFGTGWDVAAEALEMGFYLGFTGPITYKKADRLRAVAGQAPAERIVVETDGPYLTPQPYRGKRNEPAYVYYTAERLAAVRSVSPEVIAAQTTANAGELFGW